MANINSVLKNEVLELWSVHKATIPAICKSLGLTRREVEHIIFPNGQGGRIIEKIVRTKPIISKEKDVDPRELLAKITASRPTIDVSPPIPTSKKAKDPKWVLAGIKAHETRKRNLLIKQQQIMAAQTLQSAKETQQEVIQIIKEPENLTTLPQKAYDQALSLIQEAMEYIAVGMNGLKQALEILKNQ